MSQLSAWVVGGILLGALAAGQVGAQGRGATAAQARSYIYGAFLTQAAPAIMSERVRLGPELEQKLGMPTGTDSRKVYEALVAMTDNKQMSVRRATDDELKSYGARPGLLPELPVYLLDAGDLKLLVQYDLQANNIPFVGQHGTPYVKTSVQVQAAKADPAKPSIITLVWTELFDFNSTVLTGDARAKLDADVVPKLKDFADIRYININGHSDRLGSPEFNQRLSEMRAEAVRTHLATKGADDSKMESFGYGKTLPVKACPDEKDRRALIECLAPNRRVQLEIQGTLK